MNEEQNSTEGLGKGMTIIAWVLALAMMTMFFSNFDRTQPNPNRSIETSELADGTREIVLKQNRQGHYMMIGQVNGVNVPFLLDTGATDISIPDRIAVRLGLLRGQPVRVNTANGPITVYMTRIRELKLGNIVLHNVRASINPQYQGGKALLGMSALKNLEMIQRDRILKIRQTNKR